ncbi:hypothetical protein CDAR_238211 [Caerostris darwini]|uniref:Uncharacterized protein n=1 Tax=Caerostris darwini TaxID=1538125 RepID=A0AAV4TLK4_9ARAC|nr:hypothetical protein CDAR_238211 [Caerostris darwini]
MEEFSTDNECSIPEENHHVDSAMEKVEDRIPSERLKIQLKAKTKHLKSDTEICNPKKRVEKKVTRSLNSKKNTLQKVMKPSIERKKKDLKAKARRDLSPIKQKKEINRSQRYGLRMLPKKSAIKNKMSEKTLKKSLQERKNLKK